MSLYVPCVAVEIAKNSKRMSGIDDIHSPFSRAHLDTVDVNCEKCNISRQCSSTEMQAMQAKKQSLCVTWIDVESAADAADATDAVSHTLDAANNDTSNV